MERIFLFLILLISHASLVLSQVDGNIRWCAISPQEKVKCDKLAAQILLHKANFTKIKFSCVLGSGMFDCMTKIKENKADLMTMDSSLAVYASELYQLRPIAAENYGLSNDKNKAILQYYATVVMQSKKPQKINALRNTSVCSAGVGTAEGWTMPMSTLLGTLQKIPITQCNSQIQSATAFFKSMCAPGALTSVFNSFGDNPDSACTNCFRDNTKRNPDRCSFQNMYAGSYGAIKCLKESNNDLAFARHGDAGRYAMDNKLPPSTFQLLCPDGSSGTVAVVKTTTMSSSNGSSISSSAQLVAEKPSCNWGSIPSRLLVTSLTRTQDFVADCLTTFNTIVALFGAEKNGTFKLFSSKEYGKRDLMFSDWTKNIYDMKVRFGDPRLSSVYRWLQSFPTNAKNEDLFVRNDQLRLCPIHDVKWCVITKEEMEKCEKMKLAFAAKGLKPDLNCIMGISSLNCMKLINEGFADLITVDAAELYLAGKYYGLIPIAAEFYGRDTFYYAVAIVKKIDKRLIISNMKYRKTCHSGISKATGWVIPLNLMLQTGQIRVYGGQLMRAYSELISRGCVPGSLSDEFNPLKHNPLNLCELCAAGGNDRCQRNNRELYYGDSGAFRCLVERGDVAFARHTTVRENTGGRNQAYWARNRRSDDYELLCRDGTRRPVEDWARCNLGKIPGHTIVTAGYKTKERKQQMWKLLQYAVEYFSSDRNKDFQMFDSGYDRSDLMFQDSAESLVPIPESQQNYKIWLGYDFLRKINTLEWVAENTDQSGMGYNTLSASRGIPFYTTIIVSLTATLVAILGY